MFDIFTDGATAVDTDPQVFITARKDRTGITLCAADAEGTLQSVGTYATAASAWEALDALDAAGLHTV